MQKFGTFPCTPVYLKVSPEGEGFIPSHRETVRHTPTAPRSGSHSRRPSQDANAFSRLWKNEGRAGQTQGRLTVFAMVDALTRIADKIVNAGDRLEVDHKAGRVLALAV